MAVVQRDDVSGVAPDGRGWQLGAVFPVATGEFRASHSRYRTTAAGSPAGGKTAIGYVHNLSRRSAIYVNAVHLRNSGGASFALGGATTAPNGSSSGFDVGVRHFF